MKFDTRSSLKLSASAPVFKRENAVALCDVPRSPLGRNRYYDTTAFVTPVLSSERNKKKASRLNDDELDDLTNMLSGMSVQESQDNNQSNPRAKPSTKNILLESEEAFNPLTGRCTTVVVSKKTNDLVEVKRSLRLKKH